jgi:hypothetical protein
MGALSETARDRNKLGCHNRCRVGVPPEAGCRGGVAETSSATLSP